MLSDNLSQFFFKRYELTDSQKELVQKLEYFINSPKEEQNVFLIKRLRWNR